MRGWPPTGTVTSESSLPSSWLGRSAFSQSIVLSMRDCISARQINFIEGIRKFAGDARLVNKLLTECIRAVQRERTQSRLGGPTSLVLLARAA